MLQKVSSKSVVVRVPELNTNLPLTILELLDPVMMIVQMRLSRPRRHGSLSSFVDVLLSAWSSSALVRGRGRKLRLISFSNPPRCR
jgi:hypothetical protein